MLFRMTLIIASILAAQVPRRAIDGAQDSQSTARSESFDIGCKVRRTMNRSLHALLCAAIILTSTFLPSAAAMAAEQPSIQAHLGRANELMKKGKPNEALRVVDEALAQAEAQGNPAAVLPVLILRMGLQTHQRDFPGAEASAKRAFELADKVQGSPLPIGAFIALNTTILYLTWGRPALAEPWAQRAVAGMEKYDRSGSLHISALGLLAIVQEATGNYAAAQRHKEQEIALEEKLPKRNPASLVTNLMKLGELLGKGGDAPAARAAYARALEIQVARSDMERNMSALATLARIYHALGREDDAGAALERAYAAVAAAGDVAPLASSTAPEELAKRLIASDTVFAWRQIGRFERDRGRLAEAEAAFRRALAMSERIDGPGNINQPAMQVELGDLLRERKAWAAAEEAYVSALATLDKTAGGTSQDMPSALDGLARVKWAKGERAEAEKAVRREIGLYDAWISSDHPQLAPALELLAAVLAANGRESEAKPALARATSIREMQR